ncbi:hypothetical protein GCM10028862_20710 [Luteimonas pelagia]
MRVGRTGVAWRGAGVAVLVVVAMGFAGCRKPEPPPTEHPPEPVANAATDAAARPNPDTRLRDAIQAPQDRARAVEGVVEDAAARRRAEVEAQTGADP